MQRRLLAYNPCHIRAAQLEALTKAMADRYRLMVLLAAWCGLQSGEITELRRHDVDLAHGVVKVRRAVVRGTESLSSPR